jgi:biotin transport system substrate-specific component
MSYPFVAALASVIYQRLRLAPFVKGLIAAGVGNVMILACGTGWLAIVTHQQISNLLSLSVVPFLPGDALKVCAAAGIAAGWLRVRRMEKTVTH